MMNNKLIDEILQWTSNTGYYAEKTEHELKDYFFLLVVDLLLRKSTLPPATGTWKSTFNAYVAKNKKTIMRAHETISLSYGRSIKFGTAGIRNKIAPGRGGINSANVVFLTNAMVRFFFAKHDASSLKKHGVLIIGDSRLHSNEYVHLVAAILSRACIRVTLVPYNLPTPTPFASYAVKRFKYVGAIVITASHNNADNNGYKVYNDAGSQLLSTDVDIIWKYFGEEREKTLTCKIASIDNNYLNFVAPDNYFNYGKVLVSMLANKYMLDFSSTDRKIQIVYSPQFGSSQMFVPQALASVGFCVDVVKNQSFYDSEFHGLDRTMNPENFATYAESIKLASATKSDFVIHNDCDGDRIGVCAYSKIRKQWEYVHTTHLATFLLWFFKQQKQINLSQKHFVTTYVSGTLINEIAESCGMKVHVTATGPKNLADTMLYHCDNECLFAFEQSNGFLFCEQLPDKDGLTAAVMIAYMFEHFRQQGLSYDDLVVQIGDQFGYLAFYESAFWLTDVHSDAVIETLFSMVREKILPEYEQFGVMKVTDFSEANDLKSKSSFYRINFSKHNWIMMRLSNTERKLKFYVHCVTDNYDMSHQQATAFTKATHEFVRRILELKN